MSKHQPIIDTLLKSDEPSIRFKTLVNHLGEDPDSKKIRALCDEIRKSPRVQTLLRPPRWAVHPYAKWQGSHWVLATLADIGYPFSLCESLCGENFFEICLKCKTHALFP